jgi:hypothetical protein
MAFSYYATSFAIANSASKLTYSNTGTYGNSQSYAYTACPSRFAGEGVSSDLLVDGKSASFSRKTNVEYFSQTQLHAFTNSLVSTSDYPYVTWVFTSSSYSNVIDIVTGATPTGTFTASGSTSGSGVGIDAPFAEALFEKIYTTFTYTGQYSIRISSSASRTSIVRFFGSSALSTTYSDIVLGAGFSSDTFTGIRDSDFSFYIAPENVSHSYNIEYFRDMQPEAVSYAPLLRLFDSTQQEVLISDYTALLNQTISTSFSKENLYASAGDTTSQSPNTTITLTTNTIYSASDVSAVTYYSAVPINYGGKRFSFFKTTSFLANLPSYQTSSGTSSYIINAPVISNYGGAYISGFTFSRTITHITGKTYLSSYQINLNLRNISTYTKSTIAITTSGVTGGGYFPIIDGIDQTYSSYGSFISNGLAWQRTHWDISTNYTFSTQKGLVGNFVKNITDETAYFSLNLATFGGIYDFSCDRYRNGASAVGNGNNPRFFRFPNCYITSPYDPITTSISNVTINQSVNSDSISQSIFWSGSSSERTFYINYESSSGTVSFSHDNQNDFDSNETLYFLSPNTFVAQATGPRANRILPLNAIEVLNTSGQMGQASYIAAGAYYKPNDSEFSFLQTSSAESFPLRTESGFARDNQFSQMIFYTEEYFINSLLSFDASISRY